MPLCMNIPTNEIIIIMRKPMFPKPIQIACAHKVNIVSSVHHSVSCTNLHYHLYTEFTVNVIFRMIEYKISIEKP